MAPSWMKMMKAFSLRPVKPNQSWARIKWPVEETGINSVTPSTIPSRAAFNNGKRSIWDCILPPDSPEHGFRPPPIQVSSLNRKWFGRRVKFPRNAPVVHCRPPGIPTGARNEIHKNEALIRFQEKLITSCMAHFFAVRCFGSDQFCFADRAPRYSSSNVSLANHDQAG